MQVGRSRTVVADYVDIIDGRKLLAACALAVLMCWPAWVFDASFVFIDTQSYLRAGEAIWAVIGDHLGAFATNEALVTGSQGGNASNQAQNAPNLVLDESGGSTVGRSFSYSAVIYAFYASIGIWIAPFAKAFVVALFIVCLVPAMAPFTTWGAIALVSALSTLPWFVILLTPDIFASIPILFGALLVGPLRFAKPWIAWCLVVLAAICTTFHYGYPPIAAGISAFALFWLLITKSLKLRFVIMCVVVSLSGPTINYVASGLVLSDASTTPQRLPIPLARSLEDGPARWYLEEACPTAGLAICEAFEGEIPSNISAFLWDENGVLSLDPSLLARIRDEEFRVLANAFLAYPLQQTSSLSKNAVIQFFRIGTHAVNAAEIVEPEYKSRKDASHVRITQLLHGISPVVTWLTWAAALPIIIVLCVRRLTREQTGIVLTVLFGLTLNAAIFGGLSAPDWRYQSRLVWLLPLMSALIPAFLAQRDATPAVKHNAR